MSRKMSTTLSEIETALSSGLTLEACNIAGRLIESNADEIRLLQLYGLSLARLGATPAARDFLERAYDLDRTQGETAGLLGRVYKDLYKASRESELAVLARDTYLAGYRASAEYYPGINAAAMCMVIGEPAVGCSIAGEIVKDLGRNAQSYWELATLGEAHLLRGDVVESRECYHKAVAAASGRIGDISSSYHQLIFLQDFIDVPESITELLGPPGIAAFSGHMIDALGRDVTRFPESIAASVKERIGELLDAENVRIGYCSAACGADILFIEALLDRNGEVNVVLPFKEDDFLQTSVAFAGEHWVRRFHAVMDRVNVTRVTTEGYFGGDDVYRFLGKVLMGKAVLRADELLSPPFLLTVLRADSEVLMGGAADVLEQWPYAARHRNIDPTRLLRDRRHLQDRTATTGRATYPTYTARSLPPGVHQAMKCILFADIVGYSKLQEEQTPFFMYEVLHSISEKVARLDRAPEILNTWGDALFAVYERSEDLVLLAKLLLDIFRGTDWVGRGLPEHLNIRIALHAGPVFIADDPILKQTNGYGSHINRTARIEPITLPGCIYASAQFAALLRIETDESYGYEYVGRLELPKNAGLQDVYHICC
jgi:class 3 adenylate cyclase